MKKKLRRLKGKIEIGLDKLFGKTDYKKFVIISRSRTGSNLLVSLLDSHNDITCRGELFARIGDKSTEQIYNFAYPDKSRTQYRGFKLFYYHPIDSSDRSIWDLLKKEKDVAVIHLIRENLLRVHISRLIADKTDTWTNKHDKKALALLEKQVSIDLDKMIDDFERTMSYLEKTRVEFGSRKYTEVTYESLTLNQVETMSTVLGFLDLENKELQSSYRKQNKERLSTLVKNYDDLVDRLKSTQYEWMLEE